MTTRFDIGLDDPRPDNEPYYIPNACPRCGSDLIPAARGEQDIFACPGCRGLYWDWPAGDNYDLTDYLAGLRRI